MQFFIDIAINPVSFIFVIKIESFTLKLRLDLFKIIDVTRNVCIFRCKLIIFVTHLNSPHFFRSLVFK